MFTIQEEVEQYSDIDAIAAKINERPNLKIIRTVADKVEPVVEDPDPK